MRLGHKRAHVAEITSALPAAQQRGEACAAAPLDLRPSPSLPPAKRMCQPRLMQLQPAPPPKHHARLQQCPPALFVDGAPQLCHAGTDGTPSAPLSPAGSSNLDVQPPQPDADAALPAAAAGGVVAHAAPAVDAQTLPRHDSVAAAEAAAALAAVEELATAGPCDDVLCCTSSWSSEALAACVAATTPR